MKPRKIGDGVDLIGAVDWNRRLFDSLIPLPEGTSYNAYLVRGKEKTALIDTVDPTMEGVLLRQLQDVERLDYLISHHAEQDHSGTIPTVLQRYPEAKLLCSAKARSLLIDHLQVDGERIETMEEGREISLGGKTLRFLSTPWVHWPETISTFLPEDGILFSCDFFGSHLATSETFAGDDPRVLLAAKRYYAEIMMPFRPAIRKNLEKVDALDCRLIAPSHGPVYDRPKTILEAYRDWVSDRVSNLAVIPYVTMHGSTEAMVFRLAETLAARGVKIQIFNLPVTDIGELAMSLVDAATIVLGTPTVHAGPHPAAFYAAHLANALRPKLKFAAVIGSYGWGTKAVERISELIPNLKVEVLGTLLCKGHPRREDLEALDELAATIADRHAGLDSAG